ncbi:MAG: hemerythrin domain-containing protein [Microthrixaceae bacterium]
MHCVHTPDTTDGSHPLDRARPALVVHVALRRELRLVGQAVSSVAVGDTARSAVVGRHLELVLRVLHDHHTLEDALVWPQLRERAVAEVLPLVELMERQHEQIHDTMERVTELRRAWEPAADATTRADLAATIGELRSALAEHLEVEEDELLWRAEQHLTAAEWDAIGATASSAHEGKERALVFGMLQYEGDPEAVASMLAGAPAPVRFFVPRLARRAYRRCAIAIHGTPTP